VQGEVVVEFLVDASGNLKHVELRKSIPNFDEASLACVRTFRFKPALRKGRPVPATLSVPITFRIFEERRPRR
jgi:TonB family protein